MLSTKKLSAPGWIGWGILLLAAVLRIAFLDVKPPHFDEGVNGLFVDQMTRNGFYHYDPSNYHGPLHFYVLFTSQTLFGRNLWALRMPIVLVSLAAVALVLAMERYLGRAAARWAALAMAVSPAMVFYGRYAIHETWLLFFLLLLAWGVARLWRHGDRAGLWACGLAVAGAILTKETFFIHVGCFLLAVPTLRLVERLSPSGPGWEWAAQRWRSRDLAGVIGACALLVVFFYSGGFLDWSGLVGLVRSFAIWAATGVDGHGHDKPRIYWLLLLLQYEWPALIGLAGCALLLWPGSDRFQRFLAIQGTGALVAYSIVPYKTPWCLLALHWPFLLIFGSLVAGISRPLHRPIAALVLAASAGLAGWITFFKYTDDTVKYVYVQTFEDIRKLTDPLFALVAQSRENYSLRGNVILSAYHPLPWVLGDFPFVGYHDPEKPPEMTDADFILVDSDKAAQIESALRDAYFREPLRLRSGQEGSTLYLRYATFHRLFPGRPPDLPRKERS